MTNKNPQVDILKEVKAILANLPNKRLKDIIECRFGLRNGKRETLESVGQRYGITRERVRQIQDDGFRILQKNLATLKPVFQHLDKVFAAHGNLLGEEKLLSIVTETSSDHPARGGVLLALTLGKSYQRIGETPKHNPYWFTRKSAAKETERCINLSVKYFNQKKKPLAFSEIFSFLSAQRKGLSEKIVSAYLDISKEVSKNIFGEMGLSHWPEINPRGVKDRAYLVLKREEKPLHFTKITDLINETGFSPRKAYIQTVHNELIKDERFVLVGRGIYSLREWGHEPGTVKDVIARILSSAKRPMMKEEIISAVLRERQVQPNTVIINLQNIEEFEKQADGGYIFKA